MDTFYTDIVTALNGWLTARFGPDASHNVLGPLTWADLAVIFCVGLAALIVHAAVGAGIRHKMKATSDTGTSPEGAPAEGKALAHQTYGAVSKPLYALIWVCGGYFVLVSLLSRIMMPGMGSAEAPGLLRTPLADLFNVSVFVLVFWFCFRFTHVLEARVAGWAAKSSSKLDDLLVPLLGKGLRVALPVVAVLFALPVLGLPAPYAGVVARGTSILVIVAATVILLQAVQVGKGALLHKFDISVTDNLRARQVYTQIHVLGRVVNIVIGLFAVACILMLFQEVRHVGSTLLASAGVVGIIAGVAGQKTLANLFAGLQIALAQPMRQDDVLVVEGEWGRVEEITLTYVVVHIWDDRRLVLPLSYFIDKPFQNWTRSSAQLLGSIFVWVDYTFPVEESRKALQQIIEASPLWDRRFWNLQVSDASDKTMQLRVLATSSDSSKSWDLRCEVREKFIAWIQEHHPQSLPRLRMQGENGTQEASDAIFK